MLSSLQVCDELDKMTPVLPADPAADPDDDPPSLGVAVGITTGRVFCGEAGSESRREYTLAGARVNLAARLMQAAGKTQEKGVLVDDETYEAATNSCRWETLEPIKVKGKEELVRIFRPHLQKVDRKTRRLQDHEPANSRNSSNSDSNGRATQSRLKRTRGRVAEQSLLLRGLQELQRGGKGGAITLLGEAGMGKTHLVDVLRTMHENDLRGLRVSDPTISPDSDSDQLGLFLNSSKPIEATTPFFMWKVSKELLEDGCRRLTYILTYLPTYLLTYSLTYLLRASSRSSSRSARSQRSSPGRARSSRPHRPQPAADVAALTTGAPREVGREAGLGGRAAI